MAGNAGKGTEAFSGVWQLVSYAGITPTGSTDSAVAVSAVCGNKQHSDKRFPVYIKSIALAKSGRLKNGFLYFQTTCCQTFGPVGEMALGRSASALLIYTIADEHKG